MSESVATQEHDTLVDFLLARAQERSDLRLFTFLDEGGEEIGWATCGQLDQRARAVAALLQERGLEGERALLLFPAGLDFITAFLGCLYAGVVAVPAYPPRASRHSSRLRSIAEDALPAAVLTPAAAVSRTEDRLRTESGLERAAWLGIGELPPELADAWRRPPIDGGTLAFLQYTSGSTSSPKGVMVSHANLLHNQSLIQRAFRQSEESVVVGWLPLYHDMGLIGNVLQPLYTGGRCVLMSPLAFLQQPVRWLEAISRYRGTTSGGPNFAYDLCARKIPPDARERLDLSSWEVAFNGAEPVRADTLERFTRAFAPQGFRRQAFHPCYGLAEATLLVTGEADAGGPTLREVGVQALAANRMEEPAAGEGSLRLVGAGRVAGGQRITVVDPLSLTELPGGAVGEIWVAGPSVTGGYFRRPDLTAEVFAARLAAGGEGPFLRTGDLGCVERGELFVTGRLKDLVIVRGRNHYPQDIELSVERVDPALRPGCGAAFSCEVDGEERLVVVQEVERRAGTSYESLAGRVAQAIAEEHELQLHHLVLIRAGTLPKTTSGKIQRRACREAYLAGALTVVFASRAAAEGPAALEATGAADFDAASLLALAVEERLEALAAGLRELAARALRLPSARIDPGHRLVRLGLDSLAAVELQQELESRLGVPVLPGDLLEDQDLASLAAALLDRLASAGVQIPPPALAGDVDAEYLPLSHGQEALWVLHRLAPESGAYHVAALARVRPALDLAALRRALAALAARHPALRATFEAPGGEPRQRVRAQLDPAFSVLEAGAGAGLERRLLREAYAPFDLQAGPLLRVVVLRAAGEEDLIVLAAHHIVTDFESMGILARELAVLYARERGEPAPGLPPLADYGACIRWQRQRTAGREGEELWDYWRARLVGAPAALELPTDRPRPPMQTFAGRAERLRLDPETAAGLAGLARSHGSTLFVILLAVFQTLLHRLSGQDDLVVGSPVTDRARPELAGVIGYFVNPLALRAELAGDPPFTEFLGRTRRTVLGALAHRAFPFPLLAERLQPERDPSRSPLFQAMFTLQRASRPEESGLAAFALGVEGARLGLGGLELESRFLPERWAQFDLNLRMGEVERGLAAWLQYSSDLFDAATARRLLGQLSTLARAAAADPDRPLAALPLLSPAERCQLLVEWNDTRVEVRGPALIHGRFELQADRSPDAEAVVFGGESLTYGELERRANRLAHHLRALGLGPDGRAGVCLDRSTDLVVALLAILKAGAAYVPLDPAYPRERLDYVAADAGIAVMVTEARHAGGFALPRERWVLLDSDQAAIGARPSSRPSVPCPPESLAYLIYTSGSTGNPKGVMVAHRNVASFLAGMDGRLGTAPGCWLAVTSISFDISVLELLWTLTRGWKVVVQREPWTSPAPAEAGVEETIARQIVRHAVTHLQCTPSAATAILLDPEAGEALRRLDRLLLGGEALPPALADRLGGLLGGELLNMYGPTETTVWSATDRVEPGSGVVTVGRPIANTSLYLLDGELTPVPVGCPGELYIGGEGVVRGYWNRPALTADRFVPDPFAPRAGARLYRTGDLARRRGDGRIAFLGRTDHQVKVRGHRIELGEIEAVLGRHPAVHEAAVLAREDHPGDVRLVAYVALREGVVSPEGLSTFLRARLPEAMVPSAFLLLESLPHTPNGKVDRRALPAPAPEPARAGAFTAPTTPTEELLAGIFGELLRLEKVGVEDHFFELGGHSLLAMQLGARVRSAFDIELPARTLFEAPSVGALAGRIEQARRGGDRPAPPPLLPAPRAGTLPLSFAQESLWLLAQLEPESAAYHEGQPVGLQGAFEPGLLALGLSEVVRRHEALRTSFTALDGQPSQVVHPARPAALPVVDLSALPEPARRPAARGLAREWRRLPFSLECEPLLRAAVLRLDREEHVVLLAAHHIVCDGWSQAVLMRELSALYGAFVAGRPSPLPELPVQYGDFAVWQRRWLTDEVLAPQLAYWRTRLGAGVEPLELPADRPRPAVQSFRGAAHRFVWGEGLAAAVRRLSGREGATLFMTLLAAFQTLLSRYAGRERLNVGTPIAGRRQLATESLIGCFVNTLVLRGDLAGAPGFGELLRRTREVTLEAYDHQDLPFERLVEELQPERSLAYTPLFQHLFVLQNASLAELALPGIRPRPFDGEGETAKFELLLSMAESGEELAGTLEYNTDLFDAPWVERMARHLRALLDGAVADPGRPVAELPMLTAAEIAQLEAWNDTARDSEVRCLHELFEAQVARTPEAEALVAGGERWTYRQLDERANRLARYLRSLAVGPEARVGVFLERSADLVAGLLGVLKAGGAYVPLDPAYPAERLGFMLEDAGISVVLASRKLRDRLPASATAGRVRVALTEKAAGEAATAPPPAAGPGNLAYLIYTSGSTGRPKAVAIEHRSAAVLVHWAREAFTPAELAGVLAATSISFDISVFELFAPLSWGGKVILAADALELPALPAAGEVTLVNTVPSAMAELVRADALPAGVRVVNLAGETLPRPLVDRVYASGRVERVFNLYGPSEDTTYSTCALIARGGRREPSIGRPVADTRVHLLDRRGQRVPVGVPGELFLAGGGLARGYLGRPELTAERFVPDPFAAAPGGRMYRTGDLARFLPDGELEFLGRLDHQVKVRGFRIELGEIESALLAAGAREAAVLVREDRPGDRRLVAYLSGAPDAAALRSALAARLPEPLMPADFVALEALPRTPNGKLDRRELERLRPALSAAGDRGYVAPRTPIEEVLAGICAEVLGRERIGVFDHFFELGGHSLLAMRLAARVRVAFGLELPLRAVFESPRLAALAARIGASFGHAAAAPIPRAPRDGRLELSFAQERLWFLDQLEPGSPAYNMPAALRLSGRLDIAALAAVLGEIGRRHEVLRTTFPASGGRPFQAIAPVPDLAVPVVDLGALPPPLAEREAARLAAGEARRPFALDRGPLLRPHLLRLAADAHLLLLTMHHIVSDGGSLGILLRELTALYAAATRGEMSPLPELPTQYADFARWQRDWLQGEVLAEQIGYWRRELEGAPAALALPTDRPRRALGRRQSGRRERTLPPALAAALADLGRHEGVTRFMSLLAAFAAVLARGSAERDLAIGAPVANRGRIETEGLVGLFINTLVHRVRLDGGPDVRELLRRVRETALRAYSHQDLPFEQLVEALQPGRDLTRTPLFQVLLVVQGAPDGELELPGLSLRPLEADAEAAKFDLTLTVLEREGALVLRLEHDRHLFDPATAERLLGQLESWLAGAEAGPEAAADALPLLAAGERHQVVREWNDSAAAAAEPAGVHERFERAVRNAPDAVAVVCEEDRLTFAELDARANQLARHLRARGVGPEVRVGLLTARSVEMIVGLLGILKAGGAYLPMDPGQPRERLALLLADSGAVVVVTQGELLAALPPGPWRPVCLDLDAEGIAGESPLGLPATARPENLAYVIYTSGSTGRPKGVGVEHRQLANYLDAVLERIAPFAPRSYATVSTLAADLGNTMVFAALCTGRALHVVAQDRIADAGRLAEYLRAHPVDCLKIVPSHLQALLAAVPPAALLPGRLLILGGEASEWEWIEELAAAAPGCGILNHYGPTETTVGVATFRFAPAAGTPHPASLPLGRPLRNVRIHLLDPRLEPVPPGAPGELCVGGANVARGYLGRGDLTAERFLPDPLPLAPGERLYRTGDLARRLPDGRIEFLGRIDQQVKIRGFRVELGEIEAALAAHPCVRDALVGVREVPPGDRRLVAFVVPAPGPRPDGAELRRFLAESLPDFMVPAAIVAIDALPLGPTGKVDRQAAARLEVRLDGGETAPDLLPRTPVEEVVAEIWSGVLGRERIGLHESFFAAGGHSLLATRVVSRLRSAFGLEVPLRRLFESPTIAGLSAWIETASRAPGVPPAPPILPAAGAPAPLSFAQERLWFLDQLGEEGTAYSLPYHAELNGELDRRALGLALDAVLERQRELRAVFPSRQGRPVRAIRPRLSLGLPLIDLAGLPVAIAAAVARRIGVGEAGRPFDLAAGPLVRAALLRLGERSHLLLLTLHHAVSDAWSRGILVRELAALYEAACEGRPCALPELPVQYTDFARWQRERIQGEVLAGLLGYWRPRLAGVPALELPTDRPRPAVQTFRGAVLETVLGPARTGEVRALARREGATLFMALLAAFHELLHRYSGQPDLAVGSPIANRTRAEAEGVVGFFVNTLVLRGDLSGRPGFGELLGRTRESALGAYAHQDIPFEKLVEELRPERSQSRSPFFQVMLVLQNVPLPEHRMGALALRPLTVDTGTAKFDLTLFALEEEGGLRLRAEHNRDLFDGATVRRLLAHFETLLAGAVRSAAAPLHSLSLLGAAESHQLLAEWNDRGSLPAGPACLHGLIAAQAERTPGRAALVTPAERLAYRELDQRSNQLGHRLRALGVGPEVRVGLCLRRTADLIVSLLAVLKAGGAYVPLDPSYPRERLAFLIADAGIELLITQEELRGALPEHGARVLVQEAERAAVGRESRLAPRPWAVPESLAYLIYTSGSTGRPKGVAITHRSAVALVRWCATVFAPSELAGVLASTSLNFDISVFEIFAPLSLGGTVILAADALELPTLAAAGEVTLLNTVPAAAAELVRMQGLPAALRTICLAGEILLRPLVDGLAAHPPVRRVLNLYGPSEDTTFSTFAEVPLAGGAPPTIGRPLAGSAVYLLDAELAPVPLGAAGELCLAGAGLARGYLGRPELTAERFVPSPVGDEAGGRIYRTGDLARYRRDGELQFLGRVDHQVKIRGFRIELGEIEQVLAACPAVCEGAVLVRESAAGDRTLAAYVALAGGAPPDVPELRRFLRDKLPEYMVPSTFVQLAALPRTPNGKLDRDALRALPAGPTTAATVAPRTPAEQAVAELWAEVLGLPRVGLFDDFFDLGGHSLLATQVVSRLRETFSVELSLRSLYDRRTVAELAAAIEAKQLAALEAAGLAGLLDELAAMSEEEAVTLLNEHPQEELNE
jgi:amino acid adenylation domain-containing protein